MSDIYSFVFRGKLAEESLDSAGRTKYFNDEQFFSDELAKTLHYNEIDERYLAQSKSMITVFATITALENATREFIYGVLSENLKSNWWTKGVQNNIREKAEKRKAQESQAKWHVNRGDAMLSYIDFADIPKIITSRDNWKFFEPYFESQEWINAVFNSLEKSRNVIMHSGVLDDIDITRVGVNVRDWLRQINM